MARRTDGDCAQGPDAVWYVLRSEPFKELGGNYLDTLAPKRLVRAVTRRQETLGFDVTVTRKAEVQTA